jgi:hypothetical protein
MGFIESNHLPEGLDLAEKMSASVGKVHGRLGLI